MIDIMIDIETLGIAPGSVILSIGAVASSGETFEKIIDIDSCTQHGMQIDPSTLVWWMTDASAESRAKNFTPAKKVNIDTALLDLQDFLNYFKKFDYTLWSDGATFDISILEAAYRKIQWNIPWTKNQVGCYRTLKNLRPDIKIDKSNKDHTALSDAKLQLEHFLRLKAAMI